jgi:hypothetical protein
MTLKKINVRYLGFRASSQQKLSYICLSNITFNIKKVFNKLAPTQNFIAHNGENNLLDLTK